MPVATTSSRKRLRRKNSSDIEEDEPTQAIQDDVDNSDGERPRRAFKQNKANGKKRAVAEGGNPNFELEKVDEASDDERIDVDNLTNQPLRKADERWLHGLSSDWLAMEGMIRTNWSGIGDVATAMADAVESGEGEEGLKELDDIMKDLIDSGAEMKAHAVTLTEIHQLLVRGEEMSDVGERYISGITNKKRDYAAKTTRQKYAKNEEYLKFKTNIYEVLHPDTPMPPLTDFIPREQGDDSDDDDDDLEIGGVTQNYQCPISLTILINPVTSSVCGHSFSAEAIKEFFRQPGSSTKCPASGCNKSFKLTDCKADKDLEKKVKAYKRRADRAAEDSDAEEVVE